MWSVYIVLNQIWNNICLTESAGEISKQYLIELYEAAIAKKREEEEKIEEEKTEEEKKEEDGK